MSLQDQFEKEGRFLFRYRSFLPLALVAVGFFYVYKDNINNTQVRSEFLEYLFVLISFFGLAIRLYTLGYVAPKTSGRNTTEQIAESLNKTGIYSLVRHPLYLGNFFMWLGVVLFVRDFQFTLIFILVYWLYYERIMCAEEDFLKQKFGAEYTDWSSQTPAFIPKLSNYQPTDRKFDWFKVLIQEKNGFLAIFILVFSFELMEFFIGGKAKLDLDMSIFLGFLILSLFVYIILKIVKEKSRTKIKE